MQNTFATIKPMDIIDAYVAAQEGKPKEIAETLWSSFGDDTIKVIAAASHCLARLWQGAWSAGGGDQKITELGAVDQDRLATIYQAFDFLRSETLDTTAPVLATGNGAADGAVPLKHAPSGPGTPRRRRPPGARS